ncbi:hypothetical protein KR009_002231 [Drosophila setifemur]|nr:hypothetical protein KR009_002231 [Drosophila setifemur]
MSSSTLIAFCVFVVLLGQTHCQNVAIDEAILKANEMVKTFETIATQKLPPSQAAQNAANVLTDNLKTAISHCNTELQSSKNLTQHQLCLNTLESVAYVALGETASEHWAIYGATSGASRIGLFW